MRAQDDHGRAENKNHIRRVQDDGKKGKNTRSTTFFSDVSLAYPFLQLELIAHLSTDRLPPLLTLIRVPPPVKTTRDGDSGNFFSEPASDT